MRPNGPICSQTKEYKNGGHFGIRCIVHHKSNDKWLIYNVQVTMAKTTLYTNNSYHVKNLMFNFKFRSKSRMISIVLGFCIIMQAVKGDHNILAQPWLKMSGWLESWEGLLLATDVSITCTEAIFRVKSSMMTEDGFHTGCQNVSHQQQSLSRLQSPRWPLSIKVCYYWVHTIFLFLHKFSRKILCPSITF